MKTMKQFESEWAGKEGVNKFITFKPWFGEHEGDTVRVAVEFQAVDHWYFAVHAELKNGNPFPMVARGGHSVSDLIDAIAGC